MKNKIHQFNVWFDSKSYYTRLLSVMGLVLGCAVIGSFIFHSVLAYFILIMIILFLRNI